jgi:predicted nucleic acid-binding protein
MFTSKENNYQKIVSNFSPIINLAKIDKLDLIEKLYRKIIIPAGVFKELIVSGHDKENIPAIKSLIDKNIIYVREMQNDALARALEQELDPGESRRLPWQLKLMRNLLLWMKGKPGKSLKFII